MGNGGRSYAVAYEKDPIADEDKNSTSAARLLGNVRVKKYLQTLLEEAGMNDAAVDSRLRDIIFNSDDKVSVVAIRHYSELQGRVTKKLDVTTGGLSLQAAAIAALPADEEDDDDLDSKLDELEQETGN